MAEQNNKQLKKYTAFLQAVIDITQKCWLAGEGKFEVIITDERGKVDGAIKGGETFRTKKIGDDDE